MYSKFATTAIGLIASLCAVHPVFAGTWEITPSTTNQATTPSISSPSIIFADSKGSSTSLIAAVNGTTSATTTTQAHGSFSGTYTFHWVPDNSSDWPSAYVISSIKTRRFVLSAKNGTGSLDVQDPNGTLLSLSWPSSPTQDTSAPQMSQSVDTSVSNLTVTTTTITSHASSGDSNTWIKTNGETVLTERSYAASYFTSNFSSPSSITLVFTLTSSDLTANVSFNSSSSSGAAAATVLSSEVYMGR